MGEMGLEKQENICKIMGHKIQLFEDTHAGHKTIDTAYRPKPTDLNNTCRKFFKPMEFDRKDKELV